MLIYVFLSMYTLNVITSLLTWGRPISLSPLDRRWTDIQNYVARSHSDVLSGKTLTSWLGAGVFSPEKYCFRKKPTLNSKTE